MNRIFVRFAALTSALALSIILIAATSIPALADPGDRVDNRLDNKGDRVERRTVNRDDSSSKGRNSTWQPSLAKAFAPHVRYRLYSK